MPKTIYKNYMFAYSSVQQRKEWKLLLSEARKKARFSQEAVAGYLGVSRPTYAKMEKNQDLVSIEDAKKLSKLFEIPVDVIFFGPNYS